jgi:histidinol-phosphate phosphatase family protein
MRNLKAIILDRDGVLIEDKDYSHKIEDLEILPGVIEGLKLLETKFLFFIVTNQSGIGRGYYSVNDFFKYNNHLISELQKEGIRIEKTFYCPHLREEQCECRKPSPKFLFDIRNGWNINLLLSWMIGDHPSDIQFGINGGCRTVYMSTGHGKKHLNELETLNIKPTLISSNFLNAAESILKFSS